MLDDEYKKKKLSGLKDLARGFDALKIAKALDQLVFTMNDYRPRSTYVLESGEELVNVHSKDVCEGQACAIHNPSVHPLNSKPRVWRNGLIYRICDHEVEHPDFDALAHRLESTGRLSERHLCCLSKCCGIPEVVDIVD